MRSTALSAGSSWRTLGGKKDIRGVLMKQSRIFETERTAPAVTIVVSVTRHHTRSPIHHTLALQVNPQHTKHFGKNASIQLFTRRFQWLQCARNCSYSAIFQIPKELLINTRRTRTKHFLHFASFSGILPLASYIALQLTSFSEILCNNSSCSP